MLKQTVSILGCGWLGKPLAKHLITLGYDIKGSTRSPHKLSQLAALGIEPFVIDIGNLSENVQPFLNTEILIINITSKNPSHYGDLLTKIETSSVKKIIFVSSTSVYKPENKVVTEEILTDPDFNSLLVIEALFKNCKTIKTTIVRFAGLFGYDRKPGNFFASKKVVNDAQAYVNLIHQDDCIQIMTAILEQDVWGETFNGCADSHPTKKEFYTKASLDIGISPPEFLQENGVEYKIVSSKKVKDVLGIQFKHNDLMNVIETNSEPSTGPH